MEDISLLIGGKAGFGIDAASLLIGRLLGRLGYYIYIYRDYPSLIRGGHTFSLVRAGRQKTSCHHNRADILLALDQDAFDLHKDRLAAGSVVIYDSDVVKIDNLPDGARSVGIPASGIVKEENAAEIMRNSCMVAAFGKAAGIDRPILEDTFRKNFPKETELNLKVALRAYDSIAEALKKIIPIDKASLPLVTGNEAIGLGLLAGGLKTYIAYPMTPSSGILHFLAGLADKFSLKVIHPESEISVMLMALGASYTGDRVAVGTSGGGFCLMTEGLSFSGMAELPVTIVMGQRTGPSTGLPTYTGQTDLHFVLHAGHGEFSRLIVAPGDAEEAYFWSAASMHLSSRFQIPAIILSDKTLAEGTYSFDLAAAGEIKERPLPLWDRQGQYKRYQDNEDGVSPLAFIGDKQAVVKINSYEHDEYGVSTEDPQLTVKMQHKRLRKEKALADALEGYETVGVYGDKKSPVALLCWGSNKGVCMEAAAGLGLKVIQPRVLWPFPVAQFRSGMEGVKTLVCVENSATGQLPDLAGRFGFNVSHKILRCDGRPFEPAELQEKIKVLLK